MRSNVVILWVNTENPTTFIRQVNAEKCHSMALEYERNELNSRLTCGPLGSAQPTGGLCSRI